MSWNLTYLNRRNCLKALGTAAVLPLAQQAFADDDVYVQFPYATYGFSSSDRELIEWAMSSVRYRFCDPAVFANAWIVARQDILWISDDFGSYKKYVTRFQALENQLMALHLAAKGGRALPKVSIHAFTKDSETVGYVDRDDTALLQVPMELELRPQVSGEFRIYLNAYHIGRSGDRSHALYWAKVISHEMLHCLRHLHPEDSYDDTYLINAFENAIYCGGDYQRGSSRSPGITCGRP